MTASVPVFAVVGHPNEGKTSVVATLVEREDLAISPLPGETTVCEPHSMVLNGTEYLRLVDTPGFQNPAAVLEAFQAHKGPEESLLNDFLERHAGQERFHHDLELLRPLRDRAAILYVCDASRPLREVDRQEMEILRLTGLPRLALLNCKRSETRYLPEWQAAADRRFQVWREFHAHQSTLHERLKLLETLKILTPQWEQQLEAVLTAIREDWDRRVTESVLHLETLLTRAAREYVTSPVSRGEEEALRLYQERIRGLEKQARAEWRALFRHRTLPDSSETRIEDLDIFAEKVWKLLGLSRKQLAAIGAAGGGMAGLAADAVTGGISFGVFTIGGTVLGALGGWKGSVALGARRLPLPGHPTLAREHLQVGPYPGPKLLSVLIDRSMLYLHHLMRFAHARQDRERFLQPLQHPQSTVASWSAADQRLLAKWQQAQLASHPPAKIPDLRAVLQNALQGEVL